MNAPSSPRPNLRHGGRILADQLAIQGVDTVFCVPGESYLALLDGLYDHREAIRVIVTRHEAGASNMAEAYGKLTGRPGVCAVTRGPGATNAANGIHTAFQDSTPLVLLIGQVARDTRDREAFQEIDYRHMYGPMAKWVAEIDLAERIPEYLGRAFHVAQSGRPGPVVLALPEDMLAERAEAVDAPRASVVRPAPRPADMADLRQRLAGAQKPLIMVGGPTWTPAAVGRLADFAHANGLAVATSFRAQDRFDNLDGHYAGHAGIGFDPGLRARIQEADLLVVAGPRLGEITTAGYSLIDIPRPRQSLIHIHPSASELGSVYAADLAINSSMDNFAEALAGLEPIATRPWDGWREAAHAGYLDFIRPTPMAGELNLAEVVAHLAKTLPDDAIIANGAGNNTVWLHRFFPYRRFATQLGATSGSMGYGVPAAIAASLVHPDRVVVSINGDGCFQMLGQELATAVQYGGAPIILVVNNSMLATIRMHQERHFPARTIATDLVNPDFQTLARAYGADAALVTRTAEFAPALAAAMKSRRPTLIELVIDPEALNPRETITSVRSAAPAA